MPHTTLNIGLFRGKSKSLIPTGEITKALRTRFGDFDYFVKEGAKDSGVEPTMVVRFKKDLASDDVYKLAEDFDQEAIAVLRSEPRRLTRSSEGYRVVREDAPDRGEIVGPKAEEWGSFDRKFFTGYDDFLARNRSWTGEMHALDQGDNSHRAPKAEEDLNILGLAGWYAQQKALQKARDAQSGIMQPKANEEEAKNTLEGYDLLNPEKPMWKNASNMTPMEGLKEVGEKYAGELSGLARHLRRPVSNMLESNLSRLTEKPMKDTEMASPTWGDAAMMAGMAYPPARIPLTGLAVKAAYDQMKEDPKGLIDWLDPVQMKKGAEDVGKGRYWEGAKNLGFGAMGLLATVRGGGMPTGAMKSEIFRGAKKHEIEAYKALEATGMSERDIWKNIMIFQHMPGHYSAEIDDSGMRLKPEAYLGPQPDRARGETTTALRDMLVKTADEPPPSPFMLNEAKLGDVLEHDALWNDLGPKYAARIKDADYGHSGTYDFFGSTKTPMGDSGGITLDQLSFLNRNPYGRHPQYEYVMPAKGGLGLGKPKEIPPDTPMYKQDPERTMSHEMTHLLALNGKYMGFDYVPPGGNPEISPYAKDKSGVSSLLADIAKSGRRVAGDLEKYKRVTKQMGYREDSPDVQKTTQDYENAIARFTKQYDTIEQLAASGTLDDPYKGYHRGTGETMARAAQLRKYMTKEERQARFPEDDMDYLRSETWDEGLFDRSQIFNPLSMSKAGPELAHDLPTMVQHAREGEKYRKWYQEALKDKDKYFEPQPGDFKIFTDMLAATAQHASLKANVSLAKKAFRQWKRGEPFKGYLGDVVKDLDNIIVGKPYGGRKIAAYGRALGGDESATPIDVHMGRYLFGDDKTVSPKRFDVGEKAVADLAKELEWPARETQAALWGWQKEHGPQGKGRFAGTTTYGDTLDEALKDIRGRYDTGVWSAPPPIPEPERAAPSLAGIAQNLKDNQGEIESYGADSVMGKLLTLQNKNLQAQLDKAGYETFPGVHYGRSPLQEIDSSYYGQGMKGAERNRLLNPDVDPRLKQRISFYADSGKGIRPESGVGMYGHNVQAEGIYDANKDVAGILKGLSDPNDIEMAILNNGYNGYITDFMNQRSGVLLGERKLPAELMPVKR